VLDRSQAQLHWRERDAMAVPFQRPELPPLEAIESYFEASRRARWYSNRGPCFELLAARLADVVGAHAEPVANATLAIALALRAATDDAPASRREVLVPAFTFVAGAAAIRWAGFEPVFVDIEPDGWHLDAHALREALEERGERVRAVLACSTFGTPPPSAQREAWERACADAGVALVVDSAAGFGAADEHGRPLGQQGDVEIFSFHATKPLAIGEGGAVTTTDAELALRVGSLANFGFDDERAPIAEGLNAKLDEWHAATALAALDRHDDVLAWRRASAESLFTRLDGIPIATQTGRDRATFQFVPVLADSATRRAQVLAAADAAAVEVRTYFDPPLHRLAPFASCARVGALDVTDWAAERCLSLPMANDIDEAELDAIATVVREAHE
jgi:dTDP-4-amino-4,6-dideoxygalactose transaminase